MVDLKPTVSLTNVNMEPLSRKELLEWVNAQVNRNYGKIEQLCSGVAYCEMMEKLFPNSIGIKKIKINAKVDHEYLQNWRNFQAALTRLKFEKSVPIDKIMKGKFQDNFEFLQWFKKFYDSNIPDASKENIIHGNGAKKSAVEIKKHSNPNLMAKAKKPVRGTVSPTSFRALQGDIEVIGKRIEEIEVERDYYYKKLTAVEVLLNEAVARNESMEWCKRALNILYATTYNIEEEVKLL